MNFILNLIERGGPVMWPLLLCSVISMTVTIERLFFWFREKRRMNAGMISNLFDMAEAGRFDEIACIDRKKMDSSGRMIIAGVLDREHGVAEAMEVEAGNELAKMKLGLPVLDTIITLAPLLGILGTVVGIIESFELLGEGGIADPKTVTSGIATALITTATGLTVAIVTLIPYNFFIARTESTARTLEKLAAQVQVAMKKSYKGRTL